MEGEEGALMWRGGGLFGRSYSQSPLEVCEVVPLLEIIIPPAGARFNGMKGGRDGGETGVLISCIPVVLRP